jgi:hypothetical protein
VPEAAIVKSPMQIGLELVAAGKTETLMRLMKSGVIFPPGGGSTTVLVDGNLKRFAFVGITYRAPKFVPVLVSPRSEGTARFVTLTAPGLPSPLPAGLHHGDILHTIVTIQMTTSDASQRTKVAMAFDVVQQVP